MNDQRPASNSKTMWVAVGLLLVAFALRTYAITEVPPGLTHDEISQLDTAELVQAGDWRWLYPGGFAQDGAEPGYYPFLAAAQAIWGDNSLARRLPSVFANMIGLAVIYVLAARLINRRAALITLGFAAIVWWSILLGRVILREILEIPLYGLALYACWRGLEPAWQVRPVKLLPFVLGGVALGAVQYVHTIPRGLFIVFVLLGVYLILTQRAVFKRAWRGLLMLVVVAEVLAAPVVVTASLNPELDNKPTLSSLQFAGEEGLWARFVANTPWVLGQFVVAGDDAWEFNLPYRPIFEPVTGGLFLLGVLAALWRWRRPNYAFMLMVLGVSLLPSIFLKNNFTFGRLVSAQTVVFAYVGLGAEVLDAAQRRARPDRARWLPVVATVGLLVLNLVVTIQDMFIAWPQRPQTRATYNAELRDLARYLDAQAAAPAVSQCVLWIIYPWRPAYHLAAAQAGLPYFLGRSDVAVRWHDCRYSLVVPVGGQFIFAHSDLEPLSAHLGRFLGEPWLMDKQAVPGVGGAYFVDARSALAAHEAAWRDLKVTWPPEAAVSTPIQLPINFGGALDLIGYRFEPQQVKAGENVAVVTYWRVTGPVPDDALLFTHLYRTPTEVLAQQDQLDVGGSYLKPGDVFIQQHEFIGVPADTPPGEYEFGVGVYRKDTGERWPILVDDQRVADRIMLDHVQVAP